MSAPQRAPTLVVGYDGSDSARAALLFAARQAGTAGRVFIVHAHDLPPDLLGSPNYERTLSERRGRGEALLCEPRLQGDDVAGPAYELELIGGPPAEAITNVARARNADDIIGRRSRPRPRPSFAGERLARACFTSPTAPWW